MSDQDQPDDPRSHGELLHTALTEDDEDLAWDAIAALHQLGNANTCKAARQLCASQHARERHVGADILGQLGLPEKTFHEEAVQVLLDMLEHEQDPAVLHSIAVALGHRHDPRAIKPLARLKNHPHPDVREGVVHGLMAYEDELAINTLIELSADPENLIRDWATFALGTQIKRDTPAIRSALLARTSDEDVDVRAEAILGLAKRRDQSMVEILIPLLEPEVFWGDITAGDYARGLELEAAEELTDPRLLSALEHLRREWGRYNEAMEREDLLHDALEEAIKTCQPHAEG